MADTDMAAIKREHIETAKEAIMLGVDKGVLFNMVTLKEYNEAVAELEQSGFYSTKNNVKETVSSFV